jgi:hypothetical protein
MSQLKGLQRFRCIVPEFANGYLVFNGNSQELSDGIHVRHYTQSETLFT